jgi:hypothetical protein
MSRRSRRYARAVTIALILAAAVLIVLASTLAFTSGAFCSWPVWTKPGFESRVWGVCR